MHLSERVEDDSTRSARYGLAYGKPKEGRPSRPDSSVGMGTGLNRMVGKVQRDKLDHYREGRSAHRGFAGQEYRN